MFVGQMFVIKQFLNVLIRFVFSWKYDGPVIVHMPLQFVLLSIHIDQMFAMEQLYNVLVSSKTRPSSEGSDAYAIYVSLSIFVGLLLVINP